MKKYFEITAGFSLLILGGIGGLLPIIPGWPFGIAGLVILARHFHWAKRTLDWAKAKWEKIQRKKAAPEPETDSATMK